MNKSSKRFAFALAAAAFVAPLNLSALPYPQPGQEMVVTYYSNAAKTTVVGVRSYHSGCDIYHNSWGTTSQYSSIAYYGCVDPAY